MLMPEERARAVNLLAQHAQNSGMYHSANQSVKDILVYGFKGFAQFSDKELMRAIQTVAKSNQSYDIQNFVSTIAADRFLLE